MESTSEKLKEMLNSKPIKDQEKFERQQSYYKDLSNKGVAQKQTYNLKPLSSL